MIIKPQIGNVGWQKFRERPIIEEFIEKMGIRPFLHLITYNNIQFYGIGERKLNKSHFSVG